VVAGGLWTGIDLFLGFVIGPILGRLSVPARVQFSARLMPKMVLIMPTLVIVTLVAGWQLARHLGNLASGQPSRGWVIASMGRGRGDGAGRDRHPGTGQPRAALATAVGLLIRIRDFAWPVFRRVTTRAGVAYFLLAGMLEYVFLLDGTRGTMLVLVTLMLAVFASSIPAAAGLLGGPPPAAWPGAPPAAHGLAA
jgi:hypothetical protein